MSDAHSPIVEPNGDKKWYLNRQLHRETGPAVEYADGGTVWLLNGKPHRDDGPAIELTDGGKAWYYNGERHRIDGPAVEYANGGREWHLNGVQLTEQEFNAYRMNKKFNVILREKPSSRRRKI